MARKQVFIDIRVSDTGSAKKVDRVGQSFDRLASSVKKTQKPLEQNKTNTGLNNAILLETGRLASDASFGFTAIANNLGQLISLFQVGAENAGGFLAQFRQLLTIQGLFFIGIQLLISFMPRLIKRFQEASKATNEFKKRMDEAEASVQGQAENMRSLQGILNDTALSYAQKTTVLEKLRKEQGLSNIALDASGKLTKASNELVERSIRLNLLQSQARAAQGLIEEAYKRKLEAIRKARESENSGLNKFFTLVQTFVKPITDAFDKIRISAIKFFETLLKNPLLSVFAPGLALVVDGLKKYDAAVNSTEQKEARRAKTQKAIADANKQYAKDTAIATKELDKMNAEIAKITSSFPEATKKVDGYSESIKRSIEAIKEWGKATRENVMEASKIREKFFKLNQQEDFQNMSLESQKQFYITQIQQSEALEAQKQLAISQVTEFYNRRIREQQIEDDKIAFDARMQILSFYAEALGNVAQIFEEGSKAQKIAALASIAADTAIAYVKGLSVAQEAAKGTGPGAAFAFPLFYASQVASITAAVAKAKTILEGGSVQTVGTTGRQFQRGFGAPAFNVVGTSPISQLGTAVAGQAGQPTRAFVVFKDIQNAEEWDTATNNRITLG